MGYWTKDCRRRKWVGKMELGFYLDWRKRWYEFQICSRHELPDSSPDHVHTNLFSNPVSLHKHLLNVPVFPTPSLLHPYFPSPHCPSGCSCQHHPPYYPLAWWKPPCWLNIWVFFVSSFSFSSHLSMLDIGLQTILT